MILLSTNLLVFNSGKEANNVHEFREKRKKEEEKKERKSVRETK